MFRISIILAVIFMTAGILLSIVSAIPDVTRMLASPFCEDIDEDRFGATLTCQNGDSELDLTMVFVTIGTGAIIFGSLLLVFGLVGGLMAQSAKLDRIVKFGEAAEGLILDMQHTGVRVNQQPMIKFRLQVTPRYDAPYEAETSRIIPFGMMGRLAIGMTIPVKYDPKKPEDVALDFNAMQLGAIDMAANVASYMRAGALGSNPPVASLSDRLRELEESFKQGLITKEEYDEARQNILSDV